MSRTCSGHLTLTDSTLQWSKLRIAKGRTPRHGSGQPSPKLSSAEPDQTRDIDACTNEGDRTGPRRPSQRSAISKFDVLIDPNAITSRSRQRFEDPWADPLGLTVLYAPEKAPSVDIIFVHGLGGTSRQTWSKDRKPELFWPQNWLPLEPDICTARILSFGYNAHFSSTGPDNVLSISDFAKSLLFEMKFGKDEATRDLGIGRVRLFST